MTDDYGNMNQDNRFAAEDATCERLDPQTYTPDPAAVDEAAAKIDFKDSACVATYGEAIYRDVLSYEQDALSHVRSPRYQVIGEKLERLKSLIKDLNVEHMNEGGFLSKVPFLKSLGGGVRAFEKRFGHTLEQSGQLETELTECAASLRDDKATFEQMVNARTPLMETLGLNVAAARKAIAQKRDGLIVHGDGETAAMSPDETHQRLDAYEHQTNDMDRALSLFNEIDSRFYSLQANNLQLADKLLHITSKIMPYWKSQIVLTISMIKEQEQLVQKREELKRLQKQNGHDEANTACHADDLELVNNDAVTKINQTLLGAIDDAEMLQRSGQAVRLDSEATLLRLDGHIRQALISAAAFGDNLNTKEDASKTLERMASSDEESLLPEPHEAPLAETKGIARDEALDALDTRCGASDEPSPGDFAKTFDEKIELNSNHPNHD